jgi:pimeloyl-ACP methyl ester carboxylesterase
MLRASRLLYAFARSSAACSESEIIVSSPAGDMPATLYRPRSRRPTPGWIVLQGLTVFGRHHPSLLRFARALSSSGSTLIVPEIEEWTRLRIDAAAVRRAIVASADRLHELPGVDTRHIGVIGFSFGATQALVAVAEAGDPRIRTVVGFGGYSDMYRFSHFMMSGEHEWNALRQQLDPDPYARWIVAGNYLTRVPGYEGMESVRRGVLRLAEESGRGGLHKPDSYVDPLKEALRGGLTPDERAVWDLLAPPAGQPPRDLDAARELGRQLAAVGLAAEPFLDPRPSFPRLEARPVLAHGLSDRLIPYTETLRLLQALPERLRPSGTVTRLFGHSMGAGQLPPVQYATEVWRLLRLFHRVLRRPRS